MKFNPMQGWCETDSHPHAEQHQARHMHWEELSDGRKAPLPAGMRKTSRFPKMEIFIASWRCLRGEMGTSLGGPGKGSCRARGCKCRQHKVLCTFRD